MKSSSSSSSTATMMASKANVPKTDPAPTKALQPSCNVDDSDSEDELAFLLPRVFPLPSKDTNKKLHKTANAKRPKKKTASAASQDGKPPAATQAKGNKILKTEAALEPQHHDPEWIEEQAKKIVEGMSMDIVRGVVETKMLGWEVEKTGRGKVIKYYPTIRLDNDNDEAGVLLEEKQQNSRIKNGFVVKYLGVKSSLARKYDYIAASRWEPCSLGGDESTDKQSPSSTSSQQRARGKRRSKPHQLDDEARLKNFLSHIKGQSQFKDEPVDLKVEELAVRKTWETVMKQQREFELKQKEEEEQRATMQVLAPVVSQDEAPMKGNLDYYEGSENEDDEDEDAIGQLASFHSSIEENVTPSLQVGDDLEFYAPEGVAGNPMWLRRAKIMGIRPNHEYPVVFNDFINLPRTHHVRKLPNGCFRAIESYQLEEQGEVNIAMCLDRTVSNLKRARDEVNKAADDFWKNSEQEDEESSIPVANKEKRDVAPKMDISGPPVVFQSGGDEDAPNLFEENEVGDPPSARLGGLNKNINEPATGPKRSKRQRRASQRMDL